MCALTLSAVAAMNEHERERIAMALNALRPDWPIKSLRTILASDKLADRPRRDVTVALAWVACESNTATPARVLESGPWWRAAAIEGGSLGPRQPFDPAEFCGTCGKARGRCVDHEFRNVVVTKRAATSPPESARELYATTRADATANHCRHGVARIKCADCVNGDRPEPPPLVRPEDRLREPETTAHAETTTAEEIV